MTPQDRRPPGPTSGCRCSAVRPGWARWRAAWRAVSCWSRGCCRDRRRRLAVAWLVRGGGRPAVAATVAGLLLAAVAAGRSPRCAPTRWRTTRSRTWPTRAPRSPWSARSPPTRARSPALGCEPTGWSWRLDVAGGPGRGRTFELAAPVLVLGDADATGSRSGRRCGCAAGWRRPTTATSPACCWSRGDAEVVEAPGPWWRAAAAVRQSLRDSVAHRPADQRALVPALVDGDDAGRRRRAPGGLPDHRADPPARRVRHQPDPGRRVPAGAGPLVPGARAVAARRGRRSGSSGSC